MPGVGQLIAERIGDAEPSSFWSAARTDVVETVVVEGDAVIGISMRWSGGSLLRQQRCLG